MQLIKKLSRPLMLHMLGLLLFMASAAAQNVKEQELFNTGWKFYKGDVPNGQIISLNDKQWRQVTLPHDWSIELPFSSQWASATAYLPGGIGWYRKTFNLTAAQKGKRLYIYFDGVYMNSDVWINGHHLGKRPNGFTPFEYDITNYVNAGKLNVIAVRADHTHFADCRWYTGSGIYRNLYLKARSQVHIKKWGVAFTSPVVNKEQARGEVKVSLVNHLKSSSAVTINALLVNAAGKIAAQKSTVVKLRAGASADGVLSLAVANPSLWSVNKANLYKLTVTIWQNNKKVDDWSDEVGFRKIHFDAGKGFFLNDEPLKLMGVCIHDDAGGLGVAVQPEVWVRRLRKLKNGGANSIRMSHNPHADYLYKLCDKMGLLVIDEAFDEWEYGKNKWVEGWNVGTPAQFGYHTYFNEWGERDVKDMVARTRNSPSVIMWSIGNEIDYPNDPYTHPVLDSGRNPQIYGKGYMADHPPVSRLAEISNKLVAAVKSVDTSRPVTAALAGVVMSNTTSYPENLDVVGYNYQEYRYPEDHAKYPKRIIYGSENGMAINAWNAVDSNEYISAQYLWTGIDYLGEAGKWPARANEAGLINMAGFEKSSYYLRKSLWLARPVVHMAVFDEGAGDRATRNPRASGRSWNWVKGTKNTIRCYSNCYEVELLVNGRPVGKKQVAANNTVFFNSIAFEEGELVLKGYNNSKAVCADTILTAGVPALIKADVYKDELISNTSLYQQIEISITDKNGTPVYDAAGVLTVNVSQNAIIQAMENGDIREHDAFNDNKHKVKEGKLIIYLKKFNGSKTAILRLTYPGAAATTIQI